MLSPMQSEIKLEQLKERVIEELTNGLSNYAGFNGVHSHNGTYYEVDFAYRLNKTLYEFTYSFRFLDDGVFWITSRRSDATIQCDGVSPAQWSNIWSAMAFAVGKAEVTLQEYVEEYNEFTRQYNQETKQSIYNATNDIRVIFDNQKLTENQVHIFTRWIEGYVQDKKKKFSMDGRRFSVVAPLIKCGQVIKNGTQCTFSDEIWSKIDERLSKEVNNHG